MFAYLRPGSFSFYLYRNRFRLTTAASLWTASIYYVYQKKVKCISEQKPKLKSLANSPQHNKRIQSHLNSKTGIDQTQMPVDSSLLTKIVQWVKHLFRFVQLCAIFTPAFLTLPLLLTPYRRVFLKYFVKAIEDSGVVFIKVFQYLSHRRDIIGEDLAKEIDHLRSDNRLHSYEETRNMVRNSFGMQIQQFFEQFDKVPIASGSVGQVYKAVFKGQKVAVKVRHPGVHKNINRDLDVLFKLSNLLSICVSRVFEIPITYQNFKDMLNEQMYFTKEKENLLRFRYNFRNRDDVDFPKPFQQSTDQILIESFVQNAHHIGHYKILNSKGQKRTNKDIDFTLNKVCARIGGNTFFQMLMKHNFIHADCHGGNILISLSDKPERHVLESIKIKFNEYFHRAKCFIVGNFFLPEQLKKLYQINEQDTRQIQHQIKDKSSKKAKITLIDAGLVIELSDIEQKYFVRFLREIIIGQAKKTAQMIYRISKYDNKHIAERNDKSALDCLQSGEGLTNPKFPKYLKDLQDMLLQVRPVSKQISELQGVQVLSGVLNVIRKNKMKLDGQFATLLTNMLVLQAIAKDLDPDMTILGCAIPYFIDRKDLME